MTTPTPRTDAVTLDRSDSHRHPDCSDRIIGWTDYEALLNRSREIERDLAAAQEALTQSERQRDDVIASYASELRRAQEARQAAEARAESYKATIDRARRVMGGEGVEDQGQAWDQCLRILDAAKPGTVAEALAAQNAKDAERWKKYLEIYDSEELAEAAWGGAGEITKTVDAAIAGEPS